MSKTIWLLDPGHGIDTPGKRSPSMPGGPYRPGFKPDVPGIYEWELNRDVAKWIMLLAEESVNVVCIVAEDTAVTLNERCRRANSYLTYGSPVLLSIHSNAFGSGWNHARGVIGFATRYRSDKEEWLARALSGEVSAACGMPLRRGGFATANYTILTRTKMPSVLLEIGFMTNKQDMEILAGENADANRDSIARAIVKVMVEYEERYGKD